MPVWLHRKANKEAVQLYKTKAVKCLKTKHHKHYVGWLVEMVANMQEEHRRMNFCMCRTCLSWDAHTPMSVWGM